MENKKDAVFFAVYLPNTGKAYVIEECFSYISMLRDADVYIGVQYNSCPETESILHKYAPTHLNILTGRVSEEMMIDSDASSFIAALELYRDMSRVYDKCYFLHTKSITSGVDQLRTSLLKQLFCTDLHEIIPSARFGGWAPYMTITDMPRDINLMSCMKQFAPGVLKYEPMESYFIHTFFVLSGEIVHKFIANCDPEFFCTQITKYSDRYLFERDFPHIADMMGFVPAYGAPHGNYSTQFVIPKAPQITAKYMKYYKSLLEKEKKDNEL